MRELSAERSMNYESAKGWVKFQLLEFPQAVEKTENVCWFPKGRRWRPCWKVGRPKARERTTQGTGNHHRYLRGTVI